jgi:hypothetical protein
MTIVSPHTDADLAADQLDDLIEAALDYLDPRFLHSEASIAGYGDRLAFDLTLTILAANAAPETPSSEE